MSQERVTKYANIVVKLLFSLGSRNITTVLQYREHEENETVQFMTEYRIYNPMKHKSLFKINRIDLFRLDKQTSLCP